MKKPGAQNTPQKPLAWKFLFARGSGRAVARVCVNVKYLGSLVCKTGVHLVAGTHLRTWDTMVVALFCTEPDMRNCIRVCLSMGKTL